MNNDNAKPHELSEMNPMDAHAMNHEEKLTAYALGELTGDDAAQFEALIADDESARAEIEAIRAVAGQLTAVMADEPAPALTDAQREMLLSETAAVSAASELEADEKHDSDEEPSSVIYTFRAARWTAVGLAAAAVLGLAFIWPMMTQRADSQSSEFAINNRDRGELIPAETMEGKKSERVQEELGIVLGTADANRELQAPLQNLSKNALTLGQDKQFADEDVLNGIQDRLAAGDEFAHELRRVEKEDDASLYYVGEASAAGRPDTRAAGSATGAARPTPTSAAPPPAPPARVARKPIPKNPIKPAEPVTGSAATNGGGIAGSGGKIFGDPGDGPGRQLTISRGGRTRELGQAAGNWRLSDAPNFGVSVGTDSGFFGEISREGYAPLVDNPFKVPDPLDLSTFSIDVDTASYSNVRRFIESGALPPAGAVRIEELINYFTYDYETPKEDAEAPFTVDVEATSCAWEPKHRLVRIGLKGYEIPMDNRPATNLVFLIDVSGSMNRPNKLPLVKESLNMLVNELNGDDRVALAVYAGSSGLVIDSTPLYEKEAVINAINSLSPGGSTHGSAGIQLAYDVAQANFIEGGANRVVLCTDGDFNVGVTSDDELIKLIEDKRKSGVFLSVLGFGTGNYQDAKMEQLSNHGNGTCAYIDTLGEARKVLVDQAAGTLVTIAKDVKIQVDFNPEKVAAYRLIGYANRMLAPEDFNDDTKDAGEIGAGHTVTALYEIIPAGVDLPGPKVDPSKYAKAEKSVDDQRVDATKDQAPATETATRGNVSETEAAEADKEILGGRVIEEFPPMSDEMLTVRLRFKKPDSDESTRFDVPFIDSGSSIESASKDVQFAAAVAEFGMLLRNAEHMGSASWAQVLDLAESGRGEDPKGYRAQFIDLVQKARAIAEAQK